MLTATYTLPSGSDMHLHGATLAEISRAFEREHYASAYEHAARTTVYRGTEIVAHMSIDAREVCAGLYGVAGGAK